MIRHIVFFSAKNKADIAAIKVELAMLARIPEPLTFEVSENLKQDGIANEIDVVVYAEFADEAALTRYKNHPIYQECISIVRPLRELRFAADIVSL